jgi:3-methyladenine DNA glycosylase AlkD
VSLSPAEAETIARGAVDAILARARAGVPEARTIRKALSARLKRESGPDVVQVGLAIAAAPPMKAARARWVGWELIKGHRAAAESLDLATVEALGAGNSTWDEVDGYGIYVLGPAWLRGQVSDADILRWAGDADLWKRRAALVATVVLNSKTHGGGGDARRTLMVAERLVDDREDMVVKAMSWALRMLVSWDREAVVRFMTAHDARLAARVKREVRTKLVTCRKNPARAR